MTWGWGVAVIGAAFGLGLYLGWQNGYQHGAEAQAAKMRDDVAHRERRRDGR